MSPTPVAQPATTVTTPTPRAATAAITTAQTATVIPVAALTPATPRTAQPVPVIVQRQTPVAITITTSNASAGGSAAVQVFATVSRDKAERIRQDIASQGLPAIVDQVDGLYKVRVPYSTASQARANLIKVRSVSGTPGAFVTSR